ncbi:MAG TPA: DUF2934 domain-containing protein [Blastocatellia bacterium]|nr:DUF2934 domain-containing protein [Blastocatellia bacterium]
MKSTGRQPGNQPTSQPQQSSENMRERISRRAYELYLERGEQSDACENWLDAELEILGAPVKPASERARSASGGTES